MSLSEQWSVAARCESCNDVADSVRAADLVSSDGSVGWVCGACNKFTPVRIRIPNLLKLSAKPWPPPPIPTKWERFKARFIGFFGGMFC